MSTATRAKRCCSTTATTMRSTFAAVRWARFPSWARVMRNGTGWMSGCGWARARTRRQVVLDALVCEHCRLSVLLTAAEADQSAVLSEYAAHLRRWVADGGEGEMFRPSDAVLRELDEQLRDRLRERGIPAPPRDLYREPPSRLATVLRRLSVRRKKRRAGTRSA